MSIRTSTLPVFVLSLVRHACVLVPRGPREGGHAEKLNIASATPGITSTVNMTIIIKRIATNIADIAAYTEPSSTSAVASRLFEMTEE